MSKNDEKNIVQLIQDLHFHDNEPSTTKDIDDFLWYYEDVNIFYEIFSKSISDLINNIHYLKNTDIWDLNEIIRHIDVDLISHLHIVRRLDSIRRNQLRDLNLDDYL